MKRQQRSEARIGGCRMTELSRITRRTRVRSRSYLFLHVLLYVLFVRRISFLARHDRAAGTRQKISSLINMPRPARFLMSAGYSHPWGTYTGSLGCRRHRQQQGSSRKEVVLGLQSRRFSLQERLPT